MLDISHAVQDRLITVIAWAAVLLGCLTFVAGHGATADLDMWHEMALAREVIMLGRVPYDDAFAYTPTLHPVVHHEWGTGLILYFLATTLGAQGIILLTGVVGLLVVIISLKASIVAGADIRVALAHYPPVLLLLMLGFSPFRAHAFSFLFFALLLLALAYDRAGKRQWIFLAIPGIAVWANLHGGCVVGLVVLAIEIGERLLARERVMHLMAILVLSCGAVALTPYGLNYYSYLWRALTLPRPRIYEWQPIWRVATRPGMEIPMLTVSVVTAAACGALSYSAIATKSRMAGLAIAIATLIAGLLRVKLLPFFGVAFLAIGPVHFSRTLAAKRICGLRTFGVVSWTAVLTLTLMFLTSGPLWHLSVPGQAVGKRSVYPVGPVEYLRSHRFAGNVLAPFEAGAYVSWKLHPGVRVAIDSRYEVAYDPAFVDQVFAFFDGHDVEPFLRTYPTDLVIAPVQTPTTGLLRASGWRLVYADRAFNMFARPGLHLPFSDQRHREFWGSMP